MTFVFPAPSDEPAGAPSALLSLTYDRINNNAFVRTTTSGSPALTSVEHCRRIAPLVLP